MRLNQIQFNLGNTDKSFRKLNVRDRVQSSIYIEIEPWKFGTVIKQFGRSHYLVQLDDILIS